MFIDNRKWLKYKDFQIRDFGTSLRLYLEAEDTYIFVNIDPRLGKIEMLHRDSSGQCLRFLGRVNPELSLDKLITSSKSKGYMLNRRYLAGKEERLRNFNEQGA